MIKIIKELEENFKTIQIRVTELEEYYNCAFKYKYAEKKFSNDDALHFGNLVHNMIQSYLYNKEKGRAGLDILARQYPEHCIAISQYFDLMDEKCGHYNIILNEFKNILEIHMGAYKIILEGTIDIICENPDGTYTLVDIKTSKAEWKVETFNAKIQKYLYTYLFGFLVGHEKIKSFDYAIVTKHKKPRLQVLSYEPDIDWLSDFVEKLLFKYVNSVSSNLFTANKCDGCWFCPLRTTGLCPEWTKEGAAF